MAAAAEAAMEVVAVVVAAAAAAMARTNLTTRSTSDQTKPEMPCVGWRAWYTARG